MSYVVDVHWSVVKKDLFYAGNVAKRSTRYTRMLLIEMYGNVIVYILISFHSRDVLSAIFFSFCSNGLSFVLRPFGCSLFGLLLGFRVFTIN